jgi:4-amino-4-deoxy-L-arabinose transferase-like glycosyltransferase
MSKTIREFIPLGIVIMLALLVLPVAGVGVGNNTAKFLRGAGSFFGGQGMGMMWDQIEATRGPIFPAVLASAFTLLGKSVHSASLATRLFFSLGIVLTYLLGRTLYGKVVGLISSLLVLTSYGVNLVAGNIDTDIVHPFFILLFLLTYYVTLNRSSRAWAISAGISLGLSLMVKESAVFCAAIPFVMIIFAQKGKRWEHGKICLWVMGATIVSLFPWGIHIYMNHGSLLPMLGVAHPQYQLVTAQKIGFDTPSAYWINLFTAGSAKALFRYYEDVLQKTTPLSSLMVLGWLFVFVRGLVRRRKNDVLLAFSVVCFLPLILRAGDLGLRLGQTAMVHAILYVSVAALVVASITYLTRYAEKGGGRFAGLKAFEWMARDPVRSGNRLLLLIGFLLVTVQLFDRSDSTLRLWAKSRHSLAIFSRGPFKVYGRYTMEQQQAAKWLKQNAPSDAKIIADGYTHEALEFFEAVDYKIPVFHPTEAILIAIDSVERRGDILRPLYFITYSNFGSGSQRHRCIFPVSEDQIVEALTKEHVDYLVISGRGLFFEAYFNEAPWADLEFSNETVAIYEIDIDRFEPVELEYVGVNDTINDHLSWLQENHPDEYSLLVEKLDTLGLTVDELRNSRLRYPAGQIY